MAKKKHICDVKWSHGDHLNTINCKHRQDNYTNQKFQQKWSFRNKKKLQNIFDKKKKKITKHKKAVSMMETKNSMTTKSNTIRWRRFYSQIWNQFICLNEICLILTACVQDFMFEREKKKRFVSIEKYKKCRSKSFLMLLLLLLLLTIHE